MFGLFVFAALVFLLVALTGQPTRSRGNSDGETERLTPSCAHVAHDFAAGEVHVGAAADNLVHAVALGLKRVNELHPVRLLAWALSVLQTEPWEPRTASRRFRASPRRGPGDTCLPACPASARSPAAPSSTTYSAFVLVWPISMTVKPLAFSRTHYFLGQYVKPSSTRSGRISIPTRHTFHCVRKNQPRRSCVPTDAVRMVGARADHPAAVDVRHRPDHRPCQRRAAIGGPTRRGCRRRARRPAGRRRPRGGADPRRLPRLAGRHRRGVASGVPDGGGQRRAGARRRADGPVHGAGGRRGAGAHLPRPGRRGQPAPAARLPVRHRADDRLRLRAAGQHPDLG